MHRRAKKRDLKKSRENTQTEPREVLEITNISNYGEVETFDGHEAKIRQGSQKSNLCKPRLDTERKIQAHKPRFKRTKLSENGERECVLLQPERQNLTSDGDLTEPLGEIYTTLTKTRRAPSKKQYTNTRRACSKRQCTGSGTTNSGEHQRSALSSGKSLVRGGATAVTLQHDGSSCLDSTELMVINNEEIGTIGSDKMASEENKGTKQYRRRNKGSEPAGGLQGVVPAPSRTRRLKKLKSSGIFCSDQNIVTADEDIPLICLLSDKSKKRKVEVNDCGSTQACPPLIIRKESEIFPESLDASQAASLMLSSTQNDELTCCDGRAFEESSSCNVKSNLLMYNSTVVASDNEPDRSNLGGGQKIDCQDPAKEMASIDVESGHDADEVSLASLAQKKLKMERQPLKNGTQACPPSSLIRGSQLLSKRVNQLHNGKQTTFTVSDREPSELDLVKGLEVALDEPKREQAEDGTEIGDVTIASLVQNRSRKKRRLQSAK